MSNSFEYFVNERYIDIKFDSIPSETIRKTMSLYGWRWYREKACWSNRNTPENLEFVKSLNIALNHKKNEDEAKEHAQITFSDLLIRKSGFYCEAKHHTKDYAGEIDILTRYGAVRTVLVPVAYCTECGIYFVLEETYRELKQRGIIMCKVLGYKEYKALENKEEVLDTRNWRDKSPLAMWGYSVNKRDDYTDDQRHAILEDIVDSGAMTKDRVLSYLDWFISLRQGHEDIASNKWIEDRKHIAEYKLGSSPRRRFL